MTKTNTNTNDSKKGNGLNHAMHLAWGVGFWLGVRFILEALQLQYSWVAVISWLVGLYILFAIYTATVHFKYTENDGRLSFGKAYLYILQFAMLASVVGALIKWIYLQFFDTSYLKYLYDTMMPMLEKMFPGRLEELEPSLKSLLTPIRFAVNSIGSDLFLALLFGLILAPLAVRARNFFPDDNDNNDNEQDIL